MVRFVESKKDKEFRNDIVRELKIKGYDSVKIITYDSDDKMGFVYADGDRLMVTVVEGDFCVTKF